MNNFKIFPDCQKSVNSRCAPAGKNIKNRFLLTIDLAQWLGGHDEDLRPHLLDFQSLLKMYRFKLHHIRDGRDQSGRPPQSRPKIEIGMKKKSRSRFSVEIGEPEPPRKVGIKVGINRGQISILPNFFGQFPRKVGIKVGINRGQLSTLPDFLA